MVFLKIKPKWIVNAGIIKILRNRHKNVEHNPPHIHARYNEDVAAIDFMTGEVLEGHLPNKAMNMVQEWISLHKDTLMEIWKTPRV